MPPLPAGVQSFVDYVGLFSVLQGFQFDHKEPCLPYHRSCEADWEERPSILCLLYDCASGDVLDILPREIKTSKTTVSDFQVKMSVGVVSVIFKPGHRKILAVAAKVASLAVEFSAEFQIQPPMFPSVRTRLSRETHRVTFKI